MNSGSHLHTLVNVVVVIVIVSPCLSFLPREVGGEISHDGDFLVFEGNHFRNGFMYKNFVMSAIVS